MTSRYKEIRNVIKRSGCVSESHRPLTLLQPGFTTDSLFYLFLVGALRFSPRLPKQVVPQVFVRHSVALTVVLGAGLPVSLQDLCLLLCDMHNANILLVPPCRQPSPKRGNMFSQSVAAHSKQGLAFHVNWSCCSDSLCISDSL